MNKKEDLDMEEMILWGYTPVILYIDMYYMTLDFIINQSIDSMFDKHSILDTLPIS